MNSVIKSLIKAAFQTVRSGANQFGYDLQLTNLKGTHLFDEARVEGFEKTGPYGTLYYDTISACGGLDTDNIYKRMRYYVLSQVVQQVTARFKEHDLIECGCWHGHSTLMTAKIMRENNCTGEFHVFDSFEGGLSEFKPEDQSVASPQSSQEQENIRQHFSSRFEDVVDLLSPYPSTKFYKGWIPDRFNEIESRVFSFGNIDVDLYEPTLESLKFIYPRLVKGGALYLDDYGSSAFPGSKRAIDLYFSDQKPDLFVALPSTGAIVIK